VILLSLEDRQDVTLRGRVHDQTHPRGRLTADRFRRENDAKRGVRTVAMWSGAVLILADICVGITAETLTSTKCGGGNGTNPNGPIDARLVNYMNGIPGRSTPQDQMTTVKA